ncbi:MAG: phage tail assembly chaperone [Sandaracinobacteroides sp.]
MSADFRSLARGAAVIATGQLGWTPDAFWEATVAELAMAIEGRFGPAAAAPLGRTELELLEKGLDHG